MTTEELDQMQSLPLVDSDLSAVPPVCNAKSTGAQETLKTDNISVSALVNDYKQKGWTPLMRNQEATSQVCVSCEINPPVDPEEREQLDPQQDFQKQGPEQLVQAPRPKPNSAPLVIFPPPTSALPSLPAPEPLRPFSPPNVRASVVDPTTDATRKSYRSPSGRIISVPSTPTLADFPSPPPRSTTPLLRPSKTPPPMVRPKLALRPLGPPPPDNNGVGTAPGPTSDIMIAQETVQLSPRKEDERSHVDTALSHAEMQTRSEAHRQTHEAEVEDGKDHESHDEFEDAEEDLAVYRPADEVKIRESDRRQNHGASQRMLQGWAMLQEYCPNPGCNAVPLMRNREKKDYCVVCGKYYLREQNLDNCKNTVMTPPSSVPATHAQSQNFLSPLSSPTTEQKANFKFASQFSTSPLTMLPVPRATSPPTIPVSGQHHYRTTSPLTSPGHGKPSRDLNGRVSGPIVLPPPTPISPSFGMTSHQILSRYQSDELDKMAADDEEMRRHMQFIGKMNELSSRSLPPVPPVPATHSTSTSRPTSTYSNSSDKERHGRHHHHQGGAPTSPRPLSPEVQAMVDATHKTMSTLLGKLEVYRLALEVAENPKESQALTAQIKGLMECLKACREVL
ncbi:hypothetical protein BGZ80_011597 [Entomortierella chlamydospora]|uniref:Uncharacterized protein n=1 Tax=Entomortierella chlamydospora TaxID=101097 RepID=A0A9P6MT68_9FUNG|nr:hypothetical protein BGZ80_011597 [Entomortierella chlamydospora]